MSCRRAGSNFRPMPTTFAKAIASLALAGLLSSPLAASPSAPVPGGAQVERLCPLVGGIGPLAGRLGEELPLSAYGPFENLGSDFAPFAFAETELTSWSRRLYGMTYRAAHDGTTDLAAWQTAVIRALEASGWQPLEADDPLRRRSYDNPLLVKSLGDASRPRRMVVELEASGAFMLRCADYDLLRLDSDEEEERLAPGSLRPALRPGPAAVPLPGPAVCETSEWQEAFAGVRSLDQLGPTLIARLPGGLPVPDAGSQAQRLNTWLHWKMIESGQFDQDTIWRIEATVAEPRDIDKDFGAFLSQTTSIVKADERNDPVARCRTMLAFVNAQFVTDRKEAERIGKVNAALEREVRAKGVSID